MQERVEKTQLEPEVERSADVIPINKAASEAAKNENNFDAYMALGCGHLTEAEYQRINAAAKAGAKANEIYITNAKVSAEVAEITLSPEALALYSILRSDPDILSDLLHSDQQRLAEVLRIMGNTDDLKSLVDNHPNIKF